MAAAEVAQPDLVLAESAARVFDIGGAFIKSTDIQTPISNAPAGTTSSPAKDFRFPLSGQAFVDLQTYLLSGLYLPESKDKFQLEYPRELLEPFTKKDSPTLYDEMQDVLIGINNHCTKFKTDTLNTMVLLAGSIANFSKDADTGSKDALAALEIICQPGAQAQDPKVEDAYTKFTSAIDNLKANAVKAKAECEEKVVALGQFKDTTLKDKAKLKSINERSDKVLPRTVDLNKAMQTKMEAAYDKLNKIIKTQNVIIKNREIRGRVLGYSPILGMSFVLDVLIKNMNSMDGLQQSIDEFEKLFNEQNSELRRSLHLRTVSKNLMDKIDTVMNAIEKADSALQNMIGAFGTLASDLKNIEKNLELAYGAVGSTFSPRRKSAFLKLDDAGKTWALVLELSREFQAHGLAMTIEVNKKNMQQFAVSLEIVGTNYGGVDNTLFSQVLFNSGEDIKVRSVEPGFPEPWNGIVKSISVLHTYGKSMRIFACKEFTGIHYIRPGEVSSSTIGYGAELREVNPFSKPASSKIKILAIVWGPEEVRKKEVYDYAYKCAEDRTPVVFNNQNFGGDTWKGNFKSGVIYYMNDGGSEIYQVCGHEHAQASFI